MDDQNRNLILATALSFLVILVWFLLFPPTAPETAPAGQTVAEGEAAPAAAAPGAVPGASAEPAASRVEVLGRTARVPVRTDRVAGSISLVGGRIDDLQLLDYHETIAAGSPNVTLLTPAGAPESHYALYGWAPAGGLAAGAVPGPNTPWEIESGETLTETTPVTIRWDNGAGLVFRRTISIDDDYMFTIAQSVENTTGAAVSVQPYGIVARHGVPMNVKRFWILHEGVVGAADGILQQFTWKQLEDLPEDPAEGAQAVAVPAAADGWIGFTDHYWMSSLVAQPGQAFTAVVKYTAANDTFQTDMRLPVMTVEPGAKAEVSTWFFAGAKEWSLLRAYQRDLKIDRFVDAIDWGWFWFLTKPIFMALHWLHGFIGNMGVAIIALTFIIKAILFPLAYKSYVSMSKMKALQPEMEAIKERAGDDRVKMQQEVMALYKKEKVNPAAGCLPIVMQIPIFFSLYKVIFVTLELRHAPFFGWIHDLSAPDPTSWMNLFGLLPWAAPDHASALGILSIGVWPIVLGVSMWLQQKLNPAPADKTQAMVFAWMPWVFMFMLGSFASGLVIYWVANNSITFTQQYLIMRSQGVKPKVFENVLSGLRRKRKTE
ncbi:membrane protein insertase YidC [Amaricoccus sp.]|uniref:membrane protein insertase YidC n=1 Tax=Amaricoccus sp. TaxID=1872485 RepID=UPI001B405949|nr:membrane protein insertase YidC [Amaricoccus sp.]MBP7001400.1 membrane protein insertase YidC [Amaricoccus sp.]